ncbi:MAG TPA: hypothetical protein VJU87_01725 [Gemmatimonadaceae bacterium]|nr:hypothetical protein [Gemmatimonadaceae bacterium]
MLVTRLVPLITVRRFLAPLAAAFVAASMLLARTATAQGATGSGYGPNIGASAGVVFPMGSLGDVVNSGYSVAIAVGLQQTNNPLGFRAEGIFDEFGLQGGSSSDKLRIFAATMNLLYDLNSAATTAGAQSTGGFYIIGGVGLYGTKEVHADFSSSTETDFGLNGGAGYRLPLSGLSFYVEGRYHAIFSSPDRQQLIPITVGVAF